MPGLVAACMTRAAMGVAARPRSVTTNGRAYAETPANLGEFGKAAGTEADLGRENPVARLICDRLLQPLIDGAPPFSGRQSAAIMAERR